MYFGNNHFRHNIFLSGEEQRKTKIEIKILQRRKKRAQTEALCHFIIRTKRTLRKNEIKLQTKIQRIEEERD